MPSSCTLPADRSAKSSRFGIAFLCNGGGACDGCLLKLNSDLGMLMWMGLVSRELAGMAADDSTPDGDVNQCLMVLMAIAKLFDLGAEWPLRTAAAVDLVKELRGRLARVPFGAEVGVLRTEPS